MSQISTIYKLINTSAALIAGDAFCSANDISDSKLVTKATPSALANAGGIIGFVFGAVSPDASFTHRTIIIPNSITGLGAGVISKVGVNSSARPYRISDPHTNTGEVIAGFCDVQGNILPMPEAFTVGEWSSIAVGDLDTNVHQLVSSPDTAWMRFYSQDVPDNPLEFRRADGYQDGYDAVGWTTLSHTSSDNANALMVADEDSADTNYGPGTLAFPRGFLIGSSSTNIFNPDTAPRFYITDDEPNSESFDGSGDGYVFWRAHDMLFITGGGSLERASILRCIRDGYSAPEWRPNKITALNDRMRLPTDDGYYYLATSIGSVPHQTGSTEPSSSPSISDGDITWTRKTSSALWDRLGEQVPRDYGTAFQTGVEWADTGLTHFQSTAPKAKVRSRRKQAQTSTATANQILDDGYFFAGQNFQLSEGKIVEIDVILIGKYDGYAQGISIKLSGVYLMEAGIITNIGTDDNNVKEFGASITGTIADLHSNGLSIEVRVSPANAIPISWTLIRQQIERAE